MKREAAAVILAAALVALVGGCTTSQSGSSYSQGQAGREMSVRMGVVESVRQVKIEGNRDTPAGVIAGGAVGAAAGSNIGGGRGSDVGAIVGAVAGAVAGHAIEKSVTAKAGLEITVRLENGQMIAVTQEADENFLPGERVRILSDGRTTRVSH